MFINPGVPPNYVYENPGLTFCIGIPHQTLRLLGRTDQFSGRTWYNKKVLVGGFATPLKNMTSSIGMIRTPILMGTCQKWQPNHQPAMVPVSEVPCFQPTFCQPSSVLHPLSPWRFAANDRPRRTWQCQLWPGQARNQLWDFGVATSFDQKSM